MRRGWGDTCPTRVAPPTIITCRPVSEAGLPCNGIVAVAACLVKPQSGHRGAMRHRVEPTTAGKASLMLYRTAPGTGRGPAETGVSFRPRSGLARWLSQMESVAALYRMCLKIDDVACRGVGLDSDAIKTSNIQYLHTKHERSKGPTRGDGIDCSHLRHKFNLCRSYSISSCGLRASHSVVDGRPSSCRNVAKPLESLVATVAATRLYEFVKTSTDHSE